MKTHWGWTKPDKWIKEGRVVLRIERSERLSYMATFQPKSAGKGSSSKGRRRQWCLRHKQTWSVQGTYRGSKIVWSGKRVLGDETRLLGLKGRRDERKKTRFCFEWDEKLICRLSTRDPYSYIHYKRTPLSVVRKVSKWGERAKTLCGTKCALTDGLGKFSFPLASSALYSFSMSFIVLIINLLPVL